MSNSPSSEDANNTPQQQGQDTPGKKPSFGHRLRNIFHYKIQIVPPTTAKKSEAAPDSQGETPPPKEKKKKEKKPKVKPPKKPKQKKAPKPKKDKKDPAEGKKKRTLLLVLILSGVLVAGGILTAVLLVRSANKPEAKLQKAEKYTAEQQYDKAVAIYDKLITDNQMVAEAYLGMAEALLESGDEQGAILKLETGYQATDDSRIQQRLQELRPEEPPSDQAQAQPIDLPVTWSDPAFEGMVRKALGRDSSGDIMTSELKGITSLKILGETHALVNENIPNINKVEGYTVDNVFYTQRGNIRSLADLANFPNLTKLTVGYNSIDDISGIETLTKLEMLGLYCNNIEDLSKMGQLTSLKFLYLYNNQITDITPLSSLTGLQQLLVQHNQISGINAVASLTQLEELFIGNNQITDISPISGLQKLRFLYAENNNITSIEPVSKLSTLTDVSFTGNPVGDLSPAKNVQNLNMPYG